MWNHGRSAAIFSSLLLGASLSAIAPALAADTWPGASLMVGGKGYAPTPMGQVSYRDVGPRSTKAPFLLIHQSWMSMVEFAAIQNELAKLGYRSIAIDMPGFGMSDPPPGEPSIEEYAENLIPMLDYLKVRKVVVGGHHTGAMLANAFAAHHPERTAAVILHGVPYYNKAEQQERSVSSMAPRTPTKDGRHVARWYEDYDKKFEGDEDTQRNLESRTWMLIMKYMMAPPKSHHAVITYDMGPDALAIRAPTLLVTDAKDLTKAFDDRMAKLRPDFKYVVFSNFSGLQLMNEPKRWAQMAVDFAAPYLTDLRSLDLASPRCR